MILLTFINLLKQLDTWIILHSFWSFFEIYLRLIVNIFHAKNEKHGYDYADSTIDKVNEVAPKPYLDLQSHWTGKYLSNVSNYSHTSVKQTKALLLYVVNLVGAPQEW